MLVSIIHILGIIFQNYYKIIKKHIRQIDILITSIGLVPTLLEMANI